MCGIVEHHVTKFVSRRRQYDSDSLFVIRRFPLCLFVCLLHSERNLFVYCATRNAFKFSEGHVIANRQKSMNRFLVLFLPLNCLLSLKVFVWMGPQSSDVERKMAIKSTQVQ